MSCMCVIGLLISIQKCLAKNDSAVDKDANVVIMYVQTILQTQMRKSARYSYSELDFPRQDFGHTRCGMITEQGLENSRRGPVGARKGRRVSCRCTWSKKPGGCQIMNTKRPPRCLRKHEDGRATSSLIDGRAMVRLVVTFSHRMVMQMESETQ
jgi:hypothetical protein